MFCEKDFQTVEDENSRRINPPEDKKDMLDRSNYKLIVDEDYPPEWFEEYREKTTKYLIGIIKRITITDDRRILVGGAYLLSSDIVVGKLVNCDIKDAGSSTIEGKKHKNKERSKWN